MTVYGPDVEAALSRFSNEFDDLATAERQPLIDLNAVNELSEFRESWQNASTTPSEHQLSTTANTDDTAFLETEERGQYVAGYEVQTGVGVRIPSTPSGDSEMRWGYYDVDSNGDPLNGFYFGVDSTGLFVAIARNNSVTKRRQSEWSVNTADGGGEQSNPLGSDLDLSNGAIFQIEFTYYGYGPVKFSYMADSTDVDYPDDTRFVTLHKETFDSQTSIEQTNLPLRQEIDSGGTSNDALDLFVGGRQYSILGQYTTNNREMGHYRDSLTGVDDTQWYPAVSMQLKDGSDIGSIDFTNVIAEVFNYEASNDTVEKRWQLRRNTTPNNPTWITPSEVEGNTTETAMKVDVSSTSIGDGSGNATGFFMNGGVLPSGSNQRRTVDRDTITGKITDGDIVTLSFRSQPGAGTGQVNAIQMNWEERW